jgi:ubiquinone/menaquinone biosynthesis C-methylase UbiE
MKVVAIAHGMWALQALRSAVDLNIFAPMEKGPADTASIAAAIDGDRRSVEVLLDALAGLELLRKENGEYSLSEDARIYLLPTSELYLGKYIKMNEQIDNMWRGLADTIRTGRPATAVNTDDKAQEFFPALTEAIFPLSFASAQQVSQNLKVSQMPSGTRVLDLAAGAATWSIPMALDNAGLRVDALDFPAILSVTKKFVEKYGVADRYGYIQGNWRNVSWQKDAYDIVILGHILHSEGAELSKQLLKRCFDTLKPGGKIIVAEFITNDERNGPAMSMLFGVNMLMHTELGCVFSEAELKKMLQTANFQNVERQEVFGRKDSMIIVAHKPA